MLMASLKQQRAFGGIYNFFNQKEITEYVKSNQQIDR